jgi:hypothetical protein
MFGGIFRAIEDLLFELLFPALMVLLFGGAVAVIFACIALSPWNNNDHDYARQATNITYVQALGITDGARQPALGLTKIAPTNFASPTCPYRGGDLFDPTGSTAPQFGSGWAITFLAGGVRQTIDLPDGSVHQVVYGGKTLQVKFTYSKIVLFYDNFYDSLWTNTAAKGPKNTVIGCMSKQSPVNRMLIGLRYVTVFEPTTGTMK